MRRARSPSDCEPLVFNNRAATIVVLRLTSLGTNLPTHLLSSYPSYIAARNTENRAALFSDRRDRPCFEIGRDRSRSFPDFSFYICADVLFLFLFSLSMLDMASRGAESPSGQPSHRTFGILRAVQGRHPLTPGEGSRMLPSMQGLQHNRGGEGARRALLHPETTRAQSAANARTCAHGDDTRPGMAPAVRSYE